MQQKVRMWSLLSLPQGSRVLRSPEQRQIHQKAARLASRMINPPHVRNGIQRSCIISLFIAIFNVNTNEKKLR